jgi:hypothetical protein
MRRRLLTFSILLLATAIVSRVATASKSEVVGSWLLADVNGSPPGSVHIETYRATFSSDGSWNYEAQMKDQFNGMQLKGDGRWSIKNKRLAWTAGAHSGESTFSCDGRTLTLDPDPVVAPAGGRNKARTTYRRD